jgi:PPM family protein phosphatase
MLTAHGVTHTGRVRKANEDTVFWDPALGLFTVADGMGGHNAGDVASQLAVEAIKGFLTLTRNGEDFTWPYGISPSLSFGANRLMTAIKLANRRVVKAGESRDEYTGLGTTVVAVLIEDGQLIFASVGDSRIYLCADGRLEQLTQDDSWVATVLAREPGVDEAALAAHPMRHVLTNVLGAREPLDMEISERPIPKGVLLLCSDGLHGALDPATIQQVLSSGRPADAMAEELVRLALERDGSDNITALVVNTDV